MASPIHRLHSDVYAETKRALELTELAEAKDHAGKHDEALKLYIQALRLWIFGYKSAFLPTHECVCSMISHTDWSDMILIS